jgi:hypothetical protein
MKSFSIYKFVIFMMLGACRIHAQEFQNVMQARALLVRGRIQRIVNGKASPVQGIQVTLSNAQAVRSKPSFSDHGGMYYLYNMLPGEYQLEVWVTSPPKVYKVSINAPQTDLPPVIVP